MVGGWLVGRGKRGARQRTEGGDNMQSINSNSNSLPRRRHDWRNNDREATVRKTMSAEDCHLRATRFSVGLLPLGVEGSLDFSNG